MIAFNTIHAKITWDISDYGTLFISGNSMPDYAHNGAPWFSRKDKIKEVVIGNGVKNIGNYAFKGCSNLTSVTIPNSVKSIGEYAFWGCSGLTSITIPNSVTKIEERAFYGCESLTSVTIPNSVTSIGDYAFYWCRSLTSVTIPNSVTSIEKYTFEGCKSLKKIVNCSSLSLSKGSLGYGYIAYYADVVYNNVSIEGDFGIYKDVKGNSYVCNYFGSDKNITIPKNVYGIADFAFYGCYGLTSVSIPNSVTSIGWASFMGTSLASFIIPNSVTSIGNSAFKGCKGLNSITIPNSVTYIGGAAFEDCTSITSITIPESVTEIGNYAFEGCSRLTSLTFGVKGIRLGGPLGLSNLKTLTILDGVTGIDGSVCCECSGLTTISIPNSVTWIDYDAFKRTKWYDNQPDGLVYAGLVLYKYKGNMPANTNIVIKEGTKSITSWAFVGCSDLTSISIPNSVMSIEDGAFSGCSGLTSITSEAIIPPGLGSSSFNNVSKYIPVYVPANSIAQYRAANGWKEFNDFREIETYNQIIADAVIAKINAIGNVEYTDVCKGMIDDASTAYDALTETQKTLITNLDVLTTAKQTYDNLKAAADKTAANPVIAKINAIGEVEYTEVCKGKIDDASTAYDALTDDQKALVTNLDVLTTARQTYETLKVAAEKLARDKAKADAVIAKITAIGKVEYTDVCKGKIDAASTAYNALTADQKALVTNLDVLNKAQQTYETLKAAAEKLAADNAKADAVIAKITAIGKVEYTDACKGKIDAANKAYNALTADQKALVTNLNVLNKAQQTYETLKAAAEKLEADKAAFNKYKSEIVAIIEALVKDDDSDAVKEIIRKAISDIESLEYEEAISIDDNKAKVQSLVTSVNEAVENQRAEDQKTNGIEELEFAEKVNIYDLNGRKITNSMLKSGLYIRNGKKVVVK